MPNSIRLFEVGGSIRDEIMGIADILDRDFCAEAPSWEALESWCFEKMKKVLNIVPIFRKENTESNANRGTDYVKILDY